VTAPPHVLLAAMSLEPGNGGIATLARLTARVLARLADTGRIRASAITLLDTESPHDLGLQVETAKGSRLRFVASVQRAAVTRTHFIYDSLAAARAHCVVPFVRKPFMSWIHGIEVWPDEPAEPLVRIRRRWALRADTLVSVSAYTRERSGLRSAKLCWLSTESNEHAPDAPSQIQRVLMIGRVDEDYKGHHALVDAWTEVAAAVPTALLTFAGKGPQLDALRRKVAASPFASRIEVLGFVPEGEIENLWSNTAIFAMPSTGEGFGLVYIEAMRHGIPVIATKHDAGNEINVDGLTGFNVRMDTPGELSSRLIDLLKNPARAREMGREGRKRWHEHFRFGAFEGRFRPILEDFLTTQR
jgi:phosphatidyl-myo-inositol dimannoside synthase